MTGAMNESTGYNDGLTKPKTILEQTDAGQYMYFIANIPTNYYV